jgi:hypothetical protein
MDANWNDCIRFYEFVKVTLTVADPIPAEAHERKAAALRAPLVQRLDTETGDLGDFFHSEKAIWPGCSSWHYIIFTQGSARAVHSERCGTYPLAVLAYSCP